MQAVSCSFCGSHAPVFALLFFVARLLSSNQGGEGGEGTVTWGSFPRGCEGTVIPGRLLDKGGGGGVQAPLGSVARVQLVPWRVTTSFAGGGGHTGLKRYEAGGGGCQNGAPMTEQCCW